jgi:hypothetical protein
VKFDTYAKISQIGCTRDFAPCHGPGYRTKEIFFIDTDCNDFIDRLAALCEEGAMDVYAWVLMPNHFTFYVRPESIPCLRV